MPDPQPTYVVGTGRAGIEIIGSLKELVEDEGIEESFGFMAIDSNSGDLRSRAPDDIETRELEFPSNYKPSTLIEKYPYLTTDMSIQETGAERQRPVGRFKLDSPGGTEPGFSDHWRYLYDEIRSHFEELDAGLHADDFLNIFFIHSLGGGTGSGSFPLMAAILDEIAGIMEERNNIDVYLAGVGAIPEVPAGTPVPPGPPMYYSNAYASLRDLQHLVNPVGEDGQPIRIPVVSRYIQEQSDLIEDDLTARLSLNDFELTTTPFDNYFFLGVDEGRIEGDSVAGLEHYREMIDKTAAECIQALPRFEDSLVDNFMNNCPTTGAFGQSELSIRYEKVENYCQQKAERAEKEATKEDKNERKQALLGELEILNQIKRAPLDAVSDVLEEDRPDRDLENRIDTRLAERIGRGPSIATETAGDDIKELLEEIEEDFPSNGVRVRRLAIEQLLDRLDEAREQIDDEWSDVVSELWREHSLSENDEYGGQKNPAEIRLEDKATILERYFDEQLEETNEKLADAGPVEKRTARIGIDYDEWKDWRDRLSNEYGDFSEVHTKHRAISSLLEHTRKERRQANSRLQERINEINSELDELEEELDELNDEIARLNDSIEDVEEELTDEEFSERLGFLPMQNLDDLEKSDLDDLNSLADFIGEYVSEEQFNRAIDVQIDDCFAWDDHIMDFNVDPDEHNVDNGDKEVWILYPESFGATEYVNALPTGGQLGVQTLKTPGQAEDDPLHTSDPFTLKFLSYSTQGPIEAMTVFQRLDQFAKKGRLSQMVGPNYLQSFAYMEWYDRDIKNAFKINVSLTLERPPELDPDKVQWPGGEDEDKWNYIRQNGLSAYLWQGTMWEQYDAAEGDEYFDGWQESMESAGVFYNDLQQVTPSPNEIDQWKDGYKDWDDLIEIYIQNTIDAEGVEIEWKE